MEALDAKLDAITARLPARMAGIGFSDKFGHSDCVILRDSCKLADLHFPS